MRTCSTKRARAVATETHLRGEDLHERTALERGEHRDRRPAGLANAPGLVRRPAPLALPEVGHRRDGVDAKRRGRSKSTRVAFDHLPAPAFFFTGVRRFERGRFHLNPGSRVHFISSALAPPFI